MTVSFRYVFDNTKNVFCIRNDGDTYTVSELSWQYLQEYGVYNFVYKDIKHVDTDSLVETPLSSPTVYSFDVSIDG